VQLGHGIMSGATLLAHTDLALPSSAPPSLGQGGKDGRSVGRGLSACCDSRMHCAHLHGCAHPSRPSPRRCCSAFNPKGASSIRCHCISRVPSTDTASSRAGVVGRVQSVTRASVLQACIDIGLDLRAAPNSPARTPLLRWYDSNIYLPSMHKSKHDTQTTLACLHTRTHACMRTRSASACLHTLVRLCYGHKHRAQTSCGICIHASNECG